MDTLGEKQALAINAEDTHKPLSNDLYSQPHDFLAAIKEITGRNTASDLADNQDAHKKQFKKDDLASLEIVSHDPGAVQHQVEAPAQAQAAQHAAAEQTNARQANELTAQNIVRAWQDPEYRGSLSVEQLAQLPENPAGDVQYTSRSGNSTANFVKLAAASCNDCSSDNCSSSNCSSDNCSSSNCSSSNCSSNNCSSANCGGC